MSADNSSYSTLGYLAEIRSALPRVLSTLDREVLSKSYGCADRVFWCWKFTDFPGARFQEIAFTLAQLATDPILLPHSNESIETLQIWAKAAIAYWSRLQHRDGSFDEAYPYERSLAATAFTGFYVGQAFLALRDSYSVDERTRLISTFIATGDWLCRSDERHGILSNHLAAAAAALQTIFEITGENRFTLRRDYFIQLIISFQSKEGWYEEYGGADIGYQTHTTFYLAYVWQRTQDAALLESLTSSIRYFWHFLHVDGSLGGEYGSRNTRFFMPAGFELLAESIPEAGAIAVFMHNSLAQHQTVALPMMDAQNILPFINNYIFAQRLKVPIDSIRLPELPHHKSSVTHFPHSGHLVVINPHFQAIIGLSKGGTVNIFSKIQKATGGASWANAGIAVEFMNGKRASSQGLGCSSVIFQDDHKVTIEVPFTETNQILMNWKIFIVFRLVSVLSAVMPSFSYSLKNLLVTYLVRRKKPCPLRLTRSIEWDSQSITVKDYICMKQRKPIRQLTAGGRFSAIHMGSARYFEWQELQTVTGKSLPKDQLDILNRTGNLRVTSYWCI